jgi:hypothetical protein
MEERKEGGMHLPVRRCGYSEKALHVFHDAWLTLLLD